MDERNASQNFINLNIGQLLNLLDNVIKNYVRKLEKLNKSFVNNKCGISFNKIRINEGLLSNYIYTHPHIYKSTYIHCIYIQTQCTIHILSWYIQLLLHEMYSVYCS